MINVVICIKIVKTLTTFLCNNHIQKKRNNFFTVMSIVLITGGAGFLGQHIVKLLQEREQDSVKEIRILDLVPYENRLEHVKKIPVTTIIGDICNYNAIKDSFKNVETVFHCAAYISLAYPCETMELERVNVQGEIKISANIIII